MNPGVEAERNEARDPAQAAARLERAMKVTATQVTVTAPVLVPLTHISANDAIETLQTSYEKTERQAAKLAAELRSAGKLRSTIPNGSTRSGESEALRELVRRAFELSMRLQQAQLVEAEANLRAARERLARRRQLADKIIDRRMEELASGKDTSWLGS